MTSSKITIEGRRARMRCRAACTTRVNCERLAGVTPRFSVDSRVQGTPAKRDRDNREEIREGD